MWTKVAAVFATFIVACGIALLWGARRWRGESAEMEEHILAMGGEITAVSGASPVRFDVRELEGLPAPVQRYFRYALRDSQPLIRLVRLTQEGEMRMGDAEDSWRPFSASEVLAASPPALLWDARIHQAPGVNVFVRDSYIGGAGGMRANLLGLKTVRNSVSVTFHFNTVGEITRMHVAGRPRSVGADYVSTPWEGRFWQYETRDGMRIPLQGEVSWRIDGVSRPYWRGRMVDAEFDFAKQ